MKYQCVNCEEVFSDAEVIMVGVVTGWGFSTTTIYCNECFDLYQKSKKLCCDCKYWKNPTKFFRFTEPCKSCKNHNKWIAKVVKE